MTDPAPLTNEELAVWDVQHRERIGGVGDGNCVRCSEAWPCPTSRLIAALRASRAEVERVSLADPREAVQVNAASNPAPLTDEELARWGAWADNGHLLAPGNTLRLIADLRASRAEVEWLRKELEKG